MPSTPHAPVLELLIRGAAVGVYALLALQMLARDRSPARLTGALFCLGAAAHTITQCPFAFRALGFGGAPVWALSVMAAGLFWAFALELFGDNAKLSAVRLAPAAALLAIGGLATAAPSGAARGFWLLQNLVGAGLMLHVLFVVWSGWRGDLVEARRRLRGPLLAVAAVYTLIVVGVQSAELFAGPASQLSIGAAVSLLAMSLAGGAVFLRAEGQLFGAAGGRLSARPIAAVDGPLLDRLNAALEMDELWREEGLTIGALAAKLGAPEHHLRRLINENLGFRNFAAFINARRIAAAQGALGDPAQARVTVAAIAYDVGFASLAPFNRAFRDATGQTPTEWRRAAQAAWSIPKAG